MIYRPPPLTALDEQVLADIRGCHDGLRAYLFRPRRWYGTLSRVMMARAVHGSTSIEGYRSTVAETAAVLDGEDVPHLDADTPRAIAACRDAMTYVLALTDGDEPSPAMDATLLKSLHYMMMAYDLSRRPGKWRKGAVWVHDGEGAVVYTAPGREGLEGLVEELVRQVNDGAMDPLIRAAMAHLNLTLVHPFEDGNGRMARCVQSFVLAQDSRHPHFMSIEEELGRRTYQYYRALQDTAAGSWSPARSTRPWIQVVPDRAPAAGPPHPVAPRLDRGAVVGLRGPGPRPQARGPDRGTADGRRPRTVLRPVGLPPHRAPEPRRRPQRHRGLPGPASHGGRRPARSHWGRKGPPLRGLGPTPAPAPGDSAGLPQAPGAEPLHQCGPAIVLTPAGREHRVTGEPAGAVIRVSQILSAPNSVIGADVSQRTAELGPLTVGHTRTIVSVIYSPPAGRIS